MINLKSLSKRQLALGASGLVLLAGGGGVAAVAATQGSNGLGRQAYIDDVAKRLNVSPSALTAAIGAARNEQIEAAVADGRITQSEANALKQRAQQRGGGSFFGRYGHRFGGPGLGDRFVVTQYLGISETTLRSDLHAGKSLAQIASSTPGKSVEGLKAAIVSAYKQRLEKAVASGSITSQQEQQRLANLSGHVEALLKRTDSGGRGHGRRGFRSHGSYGSSN